MFCQTLFELSKLTFVDAKRGPETLYRDLGPRLGTEKEHGIFIAWKGQKYMAMDQYL